jgi:hypothetical protein
LSGFGGHRRRREEKTTSARWFLALGRKKGRAGGVHAAQGNLLRRAESPSLQVLLCSSENSSTVSLMCPLYRALPAIFAGLKVAVTLAVVGAVVGEFVGSDRGLGTLLLRAIGMVNTPLLFAALLVLTIIGVIFFALIELLERFLILWHISQRSRRR